MKILHLIWAFPIGGAENLLIDIMNEQIKKHDVTLIVVNNIINDIMISKIDKNIKKYFINRIPGSRTPLLILKLNYLLFSIRPNIIHCHNYDIINIIFKIILSASYFLTVHAISIDVKNYWKYDKIFAISNEVKNNILKKYNVNIVVVNNGINFSKILKRDNFRYRTFKIILVGRLEHERKGQDIIIRAINILIGKYNIKNIKVHIIGDGDSREYLQSLVNRYELNEYIDLLGSRDRSYIYFNLKNYNLLVQPSRSEGFGLSVLEAIAAKIPVLVSNIYGPMEIIENGKLGWNFKTEDEFDCAKIIRDIMKKYGKIDVKQKVDMAYKLLKDRYDIRNTAKKYLEEYQL